MLGRHIVTLDLGQPTELRFSARSLHFLERRTGMSTIRPAEFFESLGSGLTFARVALLIEAGLQHLKPAPDEDAVLDLLGALPSATETVAGAYGKILVALTTAFGIDLDAAAEKAKAAEETPTDPPTPTV